MKSPANKKGEYAAVLSRITEKAKRLDAFMVTAGTARAAEKSAGIILKEYEDIEKAIKAALDVEDGLDLLLTYITQKEEKSS